jgi:cytochrome b subunit of formate dehydrogenase
MMNDGNLQANELTAWKLQHVKRINPPVMAVLQKILIATFFVFAALFFISGVVMAIDALQSPVPKRYLGLIALVSFIGMPITVLIHTVIGRNE